MYYILQLFKKIIKINVHSIIFHTQTNITKPLKIVIKKIV